IGTLALHIAESARQRADLRTGDPDTHAGLHHATRNVRDQRTEAIDINHFAYDYSPVVTRGGERGAVRIGDRVAEVRERRAQRELASRGSEQVAGVKGGRRGRGHRQRNEMRLRGEKREQPVVRRDEEMSRRLGRERTPVGPHPRIHDGEVHGPLGKPLPYTGKDVLGGAHVPRRDLVRDVGEHYAVHLRQQHTPHLADVAIGGPEVREQGDEGGHTRLNAERETRNAEHAYRAPPSCSAFRVPTSALSYRRRAPRPPQPE